MSGLRVWAGVSEHARVLAMPVKSLMSPVVNEAATAHEAVALARRLQPDIVLMDVRLPGLGYVEVTRRIPDETPVAAREVPMLTPKVTEVSRGSAHPSGTGPAKVSAISRQGR
jgi:DNA-binding NarL/FixJ family response regulator